MGNTPNGDETASTKDDGMMKPLQANIVTRSRSRPFHINPKHSSYIRVRTKYLTKKFLSFIVSQVNVVEGIV